ncbi:MAG TPA: histidine phosphatase family protein, partial [Burkholderiaceae bacterium]
QDNQGTELWLFRHGETEWSLNGKHTSYTDLPLTAHGREQASALAPVLAKVAFDLVLTSPRQRARDTAELAGVHAGAEVEPNLQEWNYGRFEGLSTPEIQAMHPGWSVWADEITGGETLEQVAGRAQWVIDRCLRNGGRCALFAHAHIFRILAGAVLTSKNADRCRRQCEPLERDARRTGGVRGACGQTRAGVENEVCATVATRSTPAKRTA